MIYFLPLLDKYLSYNKKVFTIIFIYIPLLLNKYAPYIYNYNLHSWKRFYLEWKNQRRDKSQPPTKA